MGCMTGSRALDCLQTHSEIETRLQMSWLEMDTGDIRIASGRTVEGVGTSIEQQGGVWGELTADLHDSVGYA